MGNDNEEATTTLSKLSTLGSLKETFGMVVRVRGTRKLGKKAVCLVSCC